MQSAITAHDIKQRLREKYPLAEGWITMDEVTPPKTQRRFDMVSIMGWGSRGHEVLGFEIKISRSDWLRELKEPAKAEPLVSLCTRWWIVAPPGVVEAAELPPAWGLLVIHPEQIRTGKQAPTLEPPAWSDAVWRCMLLRQATRTNREPTEQDKALAEKWRAGFDAGKKQAEDDAAWDKKRVEELEGIIRQAEEVTGVQLMRWADFPALGKAMSVLRDGSRQSMASDLERRSEAVRRAGIQMRRAARELRGGVEELKP